MSGRCFNCGSPRHLIRQCPYVTRPRATETSGAGTAGQPTNRGCVSSVTPSGKSGENRQKITECKKEVEPDKERQPERALVLEKEEKITQGESGDNSIEDNIHKLFVTMHGVTSVDPIDNVKLGPVLTSTVEVEGEPVETLLDTGSPVTIISWEWLLQLLAKKWLEGQSPSE